ncbi:MAG: hypothetical protein ACOYOK_09190 [Pseudobdellovibrionaceae bacterium]
MNLQVATFENSRSLSEFFQSFVIQGPVGLKIQRSADFFAPYQNLSDRYVTYMITDQSKIMGVATFILQDALVEGSLQTIAMGCDLRIAPSRRAVLEWSKHFLPVMHEVQKTFKVQHFFSLLGNNEVQALNAFVRPRHNRRILPQYFPFRRAECITLHGQLPWAKVPLPHLRIKPVGTHNAEAVVEYIVQKSKQRELSLTSSPDLFWDKIQRWRGLNIEDFVVAFDRQDKVVGCLAPWSSAGLQSYIPLGYNLRAHNFRQFLKFGQILGWTRALTKPAHRLGMEAPLHFRHLDFVFAENADIFETLLWSAFEQSHPNEFLLYYKSKGDFIYQRPVNWISAKQNFDLYYLKTPENPLPGFLHPSNDRHVDLLGQWI